MQFVPFLHIPYLLVLSVSSPKKIKSACGELQRLLKAVIDMDDVGNHGNLGSHLNHVMEAEGSGIKLTSNAAQRATSTLQVCVIIL